jgi:hypothetical protein
MEEIKRRTLVLGIFPNTAACLAAGAGAGGGDARELDRGDLLSQHGLLAGTQKGPDEASHEEL